MLLGYYQNPYPQSMKRYYLILCCLLVLSPIIRAQEDTDYNDGWNRPTISHVRFDFKYVYFGMVPPRYREPGIDIATLPPIPGLKYRSCMILCPKDTCFASRAVLALRCPDDSVLLDWASSRAATYADWCKDGMYGPQPTKYVVGESSADICNKYIPLIKKAFKQQKCYKENDTPNEQFGFLLTDCWKTEKYCTFYEATWYDMMSCGDNTRESYYSVDLNTGKVATLIDFVPENKWQELAISMMKYLKNGNGELWKHPDFDWVPNDSLELLKDMDGCALVREGLVIFYYPYHIGAGADGEFKAIIPYADLCDKVSK